MSYTGGCQCGNIRFEISQEPIVVYTCHCTICQKQASSAFGISVWFNRSQFNLVAGELKFWITKADSGNDKICAFCSECGNRIYHAESHDSNILSLKGGALDDMKDLKPAGHIFTRSALSWSIPQNENQLVYETEPESFRELIEQYEKNLGS